MKRRRLIDLPKEVFKLPILESWLAGLTQGKPPGHIFSRMPPLYLSYRKHTLRQVTREGLRFELDLSDYMEWLIFWGIRSEIRDSLYTLIQPGWHVADVGANIGEVTLKMADRVGPSGHVYSFEPDEITFDKLKRNLGLNNRSNIQINRIGLGDKSEELVLEPQVSFNRGGARIQKHLSQGQRIPMTTLDDYALDHHLTRLDLVKIDVEGFELHVLRGATRVIQQHHPTLFIELNDDNLREQGSSAAELISFLAGMGYEKVTDPTSGEMITSKSSFTHCHMDVIAQ